MTPQATAMRGRLVDAAIVGLAAALRLPALGRIPSPAGDEGNWVHLGLRLARGESVALTPDEAFVSLLHARFVAVSWWLLHGVADPFTAARVPGALAGIVAVVVLLVLGPGVANRGAARIAALVVATHPWSVLWSRTASVPYAWALLVIVAGSLLVVRAACSRSPWTLGAALLVFSAGAHFSPLCVIPAAVSAVWLLAHARPLLVHPAPWGALGIGLLHTAPLLRSAWHAAVSTHAPSVQASFVARLLGYGVNASAILGGGTTLRHFTAWSLPHSLAAFVGAGLLLVWRGAKSRAGRSEPWHAMVRWQLVASLVMTPCVLAFGRAWDLRAVDADRYGFVWVAWLAWSAALAWDEGAGLQRSVARGAVAFPVLAGALALAGTAWGSGTDRGRNVTDGGGYRGWRTASEATSVVLSVRDAVLACAQGAPVTVVASDPAWIPLIPALDGRPATVWVVDWPGAEADAARAQRTAWILWHEDVLGDGVDPRVRTANTRVGTLARVRDAVTLRTLHQHDGRGLAIVRCATARPTE